LFDEARRVRLDLPALGRQPSAYKAALRSRYAIGAGSEELAAYLSASPMWDSSRSITGGT
jgi:hypothetical protein